MTAHAARGPSDVLAHLASDLAAHSTRRARLAKRHRRRHAAAGSGLLLAGFVALCLGVPTASGTWTGATDTSATFTAAVGPQAPANLQASITCQGGTSTLLVSWEGTGWEDGFRVDVYKPTVGPNKLVASYDVAGDAIALTIDLSGEASGRYEIVVTGYDDTQEISAAPVSFVKHGWCR